MRRERGILFSAPMVRAILDGRKTQTRRVVKLPDDRGTWEPSTLGGHGVVNSHGKPVPEEPCIWNTTTGETIASPWTVGDRLWVRETWRTGAALDRFSPATIAEQCLDAGYSRPWAPLRYLADDRKTMPESQVTDDWQGWGKTRVAIHMPRWASRLTLEVTEVRVQRLQEITEEDAKAEGVEPYEFSRRVYPSKLAAEAVTLSYREGFHSLWDVINGKRAPWTSNPWVWAVGFRRVEATR